MTFDVEAGRRAVVKAMSAIEDGAVEHELDDMLPVIDALSAALDEITRLRKVLLAVRMALGGLDVPARSPEPPVLVDDLGRVKPTWCE